MGGGNHASSRRETAQPMLRSAQVSCEHPDPVSVLKDTLAADDYALVTLFVSSDADFANIVDAASRAFPETEVVGCTTAGEISATGYTEGQIVAAALPRSTFSASTLLIEDLSALDPHRIIGQMIHTRADLRRDAAGKAHEFAFLTVDGMSLKEDELMSVLSPGLGPVPLFGGSAGDGTHFKQTFVSLNGVAYQNAAVLTFVKTSCPVEVFSIDHLTPSENRMVVTEADPGRRVVRKINAEPAAREYARVLGKDPEQLSPFTFAAHPVVVRIDGTHHVRAIQRVTEDDNLVFFSAIDEGLVLTLAEPEDMAVHLERELGALGGARRPDAILACDCILRRVEAGQKQLTGRLSKILASNKVVGFGTYGEQVNAMHVNQTMTGVAIYPPED